MYSLAKHVCCAAGRESGLCLDFHHHAICVRLQILMITWLMLGWWCNVVVGITQKNMTGRLQRKGKGANFFCKKYGLLPAAMNMMTMLIVIMVMRVGRRRKRGGWEAIRPPREPTPVLLATPSSHQHCFSSSINLFEHHKVVVNIPWLFYFTTWRINLLKNIVEASYTDLTS